MFENPKLKIERAKCHISELNEAISAFSKRNPSPIAVEIDIETGDEIIVMRMNEALPSQLSAIVGDAIHNLRSALDLFAVDLVRLNKGNINGVKFPFAQDINGFETQIRDKHIDRAAPDILKMIRELKPYRGGNDALRTLHDLDIRDKHQTIIVFALWAFAEYTLRSRVSSRSRGGGRV